jgi:cytochrome c553
MTRSIVSVVATSICLSAALNAAAANVGEANAPLPRAQQIVNEVCANCHAADGNSVIPTNPSLAGQSARYIATQLDHFKTGLRKNPIMNGMAASLTAEDMSALGTYFSQQKPKGSVAKNMELATQGQKLYRGGRPETAIPACAACHGPDGAGIAVQYPRLAGQSAQYTYDRLRKFRELSDRGGDDDPNANGRMMMSVAAKLSDADMRAVAEYLAGLH